MVSERDRGWAHFEHEADVGIEGRGESLAQAFAQAAVAMTAVITEPAGVRPVARVPVRVEETDPELLLVSWLDAVVFEMATRRMLFGRFEVQIDGRLLKEETVQRRGPLRFYDVQYAITPEFVKGKKKVTVRFQATGGNEIAAVFGIRMIRADSQ